MRPVQSPFRVPLLAARTLNATDQSRVTLSLRLEILRAACGLQQEERGAEIRPNRCWQASGTISADTKKGAAWVPLCLDDTPGPAITPANCTLIASMTAVVRGGQRRTLGGAHAGGPFEPGNGCAVTLRAPLGC